MLPSLTNIILYQPTYHSLSNFFCYIMRLKDEWNIFFSWTSLLCSWTSLFLYSACEGNPGNHVLTYILKHEASFPIHYIYIYISIYIYRISTFEVLHIYIDLTKIFISHIENIHIQIYDLRCFCVSILPTMSINFCSAVHLLFLVRYVNKML